MKNPAPNFDAIYRPLIERNYLTESAARHYIERGLRPIIESCGAVGFDQRDAALMESLSKIVPSGRTLRIELPATRLDVENMNRRTYPTKVLQEAIRACREKMERGYITGAVDDHPETPFVAPGNVSHKIVGARVLRHENTNYLMNTWEVVRTRKGNDLRALITDGVAFGVSIRGFGKTDSFNENEGSLQDYEFLGTDCVGDPSSQVYVDLRGPLAHIVEAAARGSIWAPFLEAVEGDGGEEKDFDGKVNFKVYSDPDGWDEQMTFKGFKPKTEGRIPVARDRAGRVTGMIVTREQFRRTPPFMATRIPSVAISASKGYRTPGAFLQAFAESQVLGYPLEEASSFDAAKTAFWACLETLRPAFVARKAPLHVEGVHVPTARLFAPGTLLATESTPHIRLFPSPRSNMLAFSLTTGSRLIDGPVLLGSEPQAAAERVLDAFNTTLSAH